MKIKITSMLLVILIMQQTNAVLAPISAFMNTNGCGGRRHTFDIALQLLENRKLKTIVETGTARGGNMAFCGDGGFTIVFGYWAHLNNAHLFSVDISDVALANAKTMVSDYLGSVHLVQDDSVHFLKHFNQVIDFLYLDSFDFDKNNPEPSQLHHLYEIEAAYNKLAPNAVVMIDDCDLPHGGKGKLVISYLLKKGWYIYAQGYQVIMLRS